MAEPTQHALGDRAAFQLANVTKTPPQYGAITPRWLVRLLDWKPLEAGTFRVNRVVNDEALEVACGGKDEKALPETYVDYDEKPREYTLCAISTVLNVQTRVSDLYSNPYDQIKEQLRLTIENVKERQESELINNDEYGLLKNVAPTQRVKTRKGPPTPDDLDELLSKVWKEPSFFLAHPRAIAAFGRECTQRGVPPPTVTLFGSPFLTWRGVPIFPTEKLKIDGNTKPKSHGGKTNILLLRVGEKKQGVVGLFQPGLPGEQTPGLSVRFMGISNKALASYLISLYCSVAVLTDDAIGALEDVEVETTMSTSEPKSEASGSEDDKAWSQVWLVDKDLPAGVPNPAVLARIANEFFTALPEFAQLSSIVPDAPAQPPSVPAGAQSQIAPQAITGIAAPITSLAEAELRALPASLTGLSVPSLSAPSGIPSSLPTIPGDFAAIRFSEIPAFSFLEEARPIFADPVAPRNSLESEPRTAAAGVPDVGDLSGTKSIAGPLVPGGRVRPEAAERAASYSFLGETRQLFPVDVTPILEPASSQAAALPDLGLSSRSFEVGEIRRDFPILQERVNGRPLIWLDNAATTQKPQAVIDRLSYFYNHENSNIHRAAHELAARATDAYEAAREKVRRFLNASSVREIVFVRGATEGINLVAQSWGRQNIRKDDEIVITWLEHHANIVPWQMLCAEKGARLRVAPVDDTGQVILDEYAKLLGPRTRLVSLAQVSNALGTITPAQEMIEMAHRYGAKVLLDGAQAVSHIQTDVQLFDCDFYVFSGHKVFAPTGIGAVYGKLDVLKHTQPWQGGGSMIQDVTFEKTVYSSPPARFEAGTGSIGDAVGLGAAIDYLQRIGLANITRYEHDLLLYATEALRGIPGLRLIGTAKEKTSVLSFVLDGFRTEDIGTALNREGIAVRAGHHCAQPIHRRFGLESTVRASLALYNTCEDIDALVAALWNLKQGHRSSLS